MAKDWYAQGRAKLAMWWANFLARRGDFEVKYPILHDMAAELIADGAWIEWWTATMQMEDERSKQESNYFNVISGNDASAEVPMTPTWVEPPGRPADVPPGIEERIRAVRREVVGLTNYATADGDAMGFEAVSGDVDPATVQLGLKTDSAVTGSTFSVIVTDRGKADQSQIWGAEAGTTDWQLLATITGRSGDVTYPNTTGKPVQLQVRAQGRKNNANYGQPSAIIMTTINP